MMRISSKLKSAMLSAMLLVAGSTLASADNVSVPPMEENYESQAEESAAPQQAYLSDGIANYIVMRNNSLSYEESKSLADGIVYYSNMYGVDPLLMTSLFETESTFNPYDISSAGAIGIGQIMPDTAVALGIDPYDTMQNIQGACSHLSTALQSYGDWEYPLETALAAYNAGGNAVQRYGGIPPYSETQNYVWRILDRYNNLQSLIGSNIVQTGGSDSFIPDDENAEYVEYIEAKAPEMEILDAEDF